MTWGRTEDPSTPEPSRIWQCLFQLDNRYAGILVQDEGKPMDPDWRTSHPMHPEDVVEVIREVVERSVIFRTAKPGKMPHVAIRYALDLEPDDALQRIQRVTQDCSLSLQIGDTWQKHEPTGGWKLMGDED